MNALTDPRVQRALDNLATLHTLAQRAETDRLTAAETALAAGATQGQLRAGMGGLDLADVLILFARSRP